MKFLIPLFLLLGNTLFAQVEIRGNTKIETDTFEGDSIISSPNGNFNDLIKLEQLNKSNATFEIRLYTLHSLNSTKSVRRIYLVNNVWKADEYSEWNKPKKIKEYKLTAKPNYETVFKKLLSYNVLTLPSQDSLKSKMQKLTEEISEDGYPTYRVTRVLDGNIYTIEIKIGNNYRVYKFDNPETYSKVYDDVRELKDYASIVQTFKEDLIRN